MRISDWSSDVCSSDLWVEAGPAHPLRMVEHPPNGDPTPYIEVRDRLEALVLRPVYYELAELAMPAPPSGPGPAGCLGVWSHDAFFVLGPAQRCGGDNAGTGSMTWRADELLTRLAGLPAPGAR